MTYFQACKLNCQICKTYFCFEPLLSALSFANSATLELTLANRNLGFQSSSSLCHHCAIGAACSMIAQIRAKKNVDYARIHRNFNNIPCYFVPYLL